MCSFAYGSGTDECENNYNCGTICEDSDTTEKYPLGDNPFVKGSFEGKDDYCESNGELHEVMCAPTSNEKLIDCSSLGDYLCYDGRCVENKCTDSDVSNDYPDGKNFFVKGGVRGYGDSYISDDFCYNNKRLTECSGRDCYLFEQYCKSPFDSGDVELYNCPLGCKDGACVPAS